MNTDRMQFTILDDGTVVVDVDGAISGPNHRSADEMLAVVARTLGGPVSTTERKDAHHHDVAHAHDHDHAHGHDHKHHKHHKHHEH